MVSRFLSARYPQCCASGMSTRITRCSGCGSGRPRCCRGWRRAAEASAHFCPHCFSARGAFQPAVFLTLRLAHFCPRCFSARGCSSRRVGADGAALSPLQTLRTLLDTSVLMGQRCLLCKHFNCSWLDSLPEKSYIDTRVSSSPTFTVSLDHQHGNEQYSTEHA